LTALYLIRHTPVAEGEGVCYGVADLPLAQEPGAAAERLKALLPGRYELVSSPLARCLALARALGEPRIEPHLEPGLREIDFGRWELKRWNEIDREALDAWGRDPIDYRPPGGESARDMSRRALPALSRWLERRAGALVIVSHGGPLRAIAGTLLGLPAERWLALEFGHGTLTHLHVRGDAATVLRGFNL
jgi:alpha-ribazole phosphatase